MNPPNTTTIPTDIVAMNLTISLVLIAIGGVSVAIVGLFF